MLDASGHDDEVAFSQLRHAVSEVDCDAAAQNEKGLVLLVMGMPIELCAKLRDFHLIIVHVADDERLKDLLDLSIRRLDDVKFARRHRCSPFTKPRFARH